MNKCQVCAYFPESKIDMARKTRESIDQATLALSGIGNQIYCRADIGQDLEEIQNLTAVGDGQPATVKHENGQVTLIVFWDSGCKTTDSFMKEIQKLSEDKKKRKWVNKVRFIAFGLDTDI